MHVNDIIVSALTPGSPLNEKGKIWRSAKHLANYTGLDHQALMGVLVGDMGNQVKVKPSPKKGLLVALKINIPVAAPDGPPIDGPKVKVQAGNAHVAPAIPKAKQLLAEEGVDMIKPDVVVHFAAGDAHIVALDHAVEHGDDPAPANQEVLAKFNEMLVDAAAPNLDDEDDFDDEDEDFDDEDLDD